MEAVRDVEVEVTLTNGVTRTCTLASDSPELGNLHVALAAAEQPQGVRPEIFFQLPMDGGKAAFSFLSTSLLSVVTRPPVLVDQAQYVAPAMVAGQSAAALTHVLIDDFLTPAENADLLQYALDSEENFEGSTVYLEKGKKHDKSYRRSRVLFGIGESQWRGVFLERLKQHLPHICVALGVPDFTFDESEIQLTASNDGDFFKRHADADHNNERLARRVVTFVYYLNKTPKPYTGGDLLIYGDTPLNPGVALGSNVTAIAPKNNALVSFLSDRWHEVDMVHCPSGAFPDSRFTVNGWLLRHDG